MRLHDADDLLLDPPGVKVHAVDGDAGRRIDPDIDPTPVRQVLVSARRAAGLLDEPGLRANRQVSRGVDIQIDVRFSIRGAAGLGAAERHRRDMWEAGESCRKLVRALLCARR